MDNSNIKILNQFKPIAKQLEAINNKLIDKIIKSSGSYFIQENVLTQNLLSLLWPYVLGKYQNILKSNAIASTYTNKLLTENLAKELTEQVTTIVRDRIVKNIDVIVEVRPDSKIDVHDYDKIVKKNPNVNRIDALKQSAKSEISTKGTKYNYRQLKDLNESISRYANNKSTQDFYEMNYKESLAKGEQPLATDKIWLWSMLENTRHSGMDTQEVFLFDKFEVLNEITFASDNLRFPRDVENDGSKCANICGCKCSVLYVYNKS